MRNHILGLRTVIVILILCCSAQWGRTSEIYSLGGQQVLLYKIINWWYFASDEDSKQLCGESIGYRSSGTAEIHLSPNDSSMEIVFNQQCAPLLALVGNRDAHQEKTSMDALWVNEDYFTSRTATLTVEENPHTNSCSISVENVPYEQQDSLLGHQSLLTLSVTGTVQGLGEGKVALNPASDLLGKCSGSRDESAPTEAPIFMLSLTEQGPPLLKFTLPTR